MKVDAAKREFENYLTKRRVSLPSLSPEEGFAACLDFYRDLRAADCEDREGDMLLVQWGVYDWGRGEVFEFGITRQFILRGSEDEAIFQLSLTFRFLPSEEFRVFGRSNRWCESREVLPAFEELIKVLPAYLSVASRRDAQLELRFECAG